MKILVSKTRMVATVLKEVELPKDIAYRRMKFTEYLIAISLYAIIAGTILLAYIPHNRTDIAGFSLGVVITFMGLEAGETAVIGVVSALLLVSTILSIFMPGYVELQTLSANYVAGVAFGFLMYYVIIFAYGYTTLNDRSVFIPSNLTIHSAIAQSLQKSKNTVSVNTQKTNTKTKTSGKTVRDKKTTGGKNGKA